MLVHCSVENQLKFYNQSSEIIGLIQQIDHRLQLEKSINKKIHLVSISTVYKSNIHMEAFYLKLQKYIKHSGKLRGSHCIIATVMSSLKQCS